MEFKELTCPYEDRPGRTCKAHLTDIEANVPVTVICRCRQKHSDGKKRLIVFTQNAYGLITYYQLPDESKHRAFYTASPTVMVCEDGNRDVVNAAQLPQSENSD